MSNAIRSIAAALAVALFAAPAVAQQSAFRLNDREYFERGGVNVMAFQDIYPDGHQGGVSIIQQGVRVASNGDLRLEPTPGQWSPMPQQDRRVVDQARGEITTWLSFPDTSKDRHGFNPIVYPDLKLAYQVHVRADGDAVRITVDLDKPLPAEWVGKVGFNLELYPTILFGRSWYLGGRSGIFPRQADGPVVVAAGGETQPVPMATGPRLSIAPEVDAQRLIVESTTGDLSLYDGRNEYNNGWFVVRSLVPAGATKGAIEWVLHPNAVPGWRYTPVVQVSQVGYHPAQRKVAVIELDARDDSVGTATLERIGENGGFEPVLSARPSVWGDFLRYRYLRFDFTSVKRPGMYVVEYRGVRTNPFRIATDVYAHGVWQPTLEYFLPIQMCHMRVEDNYRVWHGADHLDDARMAPADSNHFDGYAQGPSTLTRFRGGDRVPGLDRGGWHDAGDSDLRIESQADEVWILASTYELFHETYDQTSVDENALVTKIHRPDGEPDLLQQVRHGLLTILGGYRSLGRLYRGIIVPTLPQYTLLGDQLNATDDLFYSASLAPGQRTATESGKPDDRMVFTEENPAHEYKGIAALAIAGRVMRASDPALAKESQAAAEALWHRPRDPGRGFAERIEAATELLLTTSKPEYRQFLLDQRDSIVAHIGQVGWALGRVVPLMHDAVWERAVHDAVAADFARVRKVQEKTPYGVPYEPYIWGAGWGIQEFGVHQYFLHRGFPDVVTPEYMLNALNFVLGTHPGSNTASFASGVGARSMTVAYGFNRADWSYIPGGVVSGTALIRPDFPELKDFPYLWQQAEYVMGGGATNFMFLAIAADHVLNDPGAAAGR
ncbi:MAG TPA: glycoside hydrolase family 9 protein [Longimicrobiaceae bacterium]|nr:glycoside hydrolase family 9 protein [Longimicrobiaceae bacterium]